MIFSLSNLWYFFFGAVTENLAWAKLGEIK